MNDDITEGDLVGGETIFSDGTRRRIVAAMSAVPLAAQAETIAALFEQVEGAFGSVSGMAEAVTTLIEGDPDEVVRSGLLDVDEIR